MVKDATIAGQLDLARGWFWQIEVSGYLKIKLRSCLDQMAAFAGLLQRCERGMRRGLTILMYHRILPEAQCHNYPLNSLVIPVDVFRQQMDWLTANFRVLPVKEAMEELLSGGPFTNPLVAVTFDDGYADNFELAAPVLEEHGLRATFFVSSGFVDKGKVQWFDRAADAWTHISDENRKFLLEQVQSGMKLLNGAPPLNTYTWMSCLKRVDPAARIDLVKKAESLAGRLINPELYRPMTPGQVAELYRRGHEIGSHTVNHPILPQLADDQLQEELKLSAEQLRKWTGGQIVGFCYPNGDFDSRVEQAVIKAGYTYACIIKGEMNRPDTSATRLVRRPITMRRTVRTGCKHDGLGFRAELCGLRELWR
jgi:peptidoglycan/xylan/chitin deacetylase (PgdA/CDA1 family)